VTKLNQVIAIEKGVKGRHASEIGEVYKLAQKPALFNGQTRTYLKLKEDGEDLPQERQIVQVASSDILRRVQRSSTELVDLEYVKDKTNCIAKATVVVEGVTVVADAPVSYLLFLEKQLTDLKTFIASIPALDNAEEWEKDPHSGLYKSKETKTHRTKKVQRPIVKYDATEHHPAQTEMITDDVLVGHWATVKQSGAMPVTERNAMVERVEKLLNAVKEAREEANMHEAVATAHVGQKIFGYVLEGK